MWRRAERVHALQAGAAALVLGCAALPAQADDARPALSLHAEDAKPALSARDDAKPALSARVAEAIAYEHGEGVA
jgi:hypothetical protein